MKIAKFRLKYALILIASMTFFSCSDGEDGMTGPMGAQGEQGLQGPAGPQGPAGQDGTDGTNGVDGENGNANVVVSDWIPADFSDTPSTFSAFQVEAPGTSTFGAFLVYGRRFEAADGIGNQIYSMPNVWFNERYSYWIDEGEFNIPLGTNTPNTVVFTARSIDGSDEVFGRFEEMRYVNIPAQTSGKSAIDFTKMTYKEVMDHFGLDY